MDLCGVRSHHGLLEHWPLFSIESVQGGTTSMTKAGHHRALSALPTLPFAAETHCFCRSFCSNPQFRKLAQLPSPDNYPYTAFYSWPMSHVQSQEEMSDPSGWRWTWTWNPLGYVAFMLYSQGTKPCWRQSCTSR